MHDPPARVAGHGECVVRCTCVESKYVLVLYGAGSRVHSRSQVWLYWSTIVSSNGNSTRLGLRTTERCGCADRLVPPAVHGCVLHAARCAVPCRVGYGRWAALGFGDSMVGSKAYVAYFAPPANGSADGSGSGVRLYSMSSLAAAGVRLLSTPSTSSVWALAGGSLAAEWVVSASAANALLQVDFDSDQPIVYALGDTWTAAAPLERDVHFAVSRSSTMVNFRTLTAVAHSLDSQLLAHAWLMAIAWLALVPAGVACVRYIRRLAPSQKWCARADAEPLWLMLHRLLVLSAAVMTAVGLGLGISDGYQRSAHFASAHARIGLAVIVGLGAQAAGGTLRPANSEPKTTKRRSFEYAHRVLALVLGVGAIAALLTGIERFGDRGLGKGTVQSALVGAVIILVAWPMAAIAAELPQCRKVKKVDSLPAASSASTRSSMVPLCRWVTALVLLTALTIALMAWVASAPADSAPALQINELASTRAADTGSIQSNAPSSPAMYRTNSPQKVVPSELPSLSAAPTLSGALAMPTPTRPPSKCIGSACYLQNRTFFLRFPATIDTFSAAISRQLSDGVASSFHVNQTDISMQLHSAPASVIAEFMLLVPVNQSFFDSVIAKFKAEQERLQSAGYSGIAVVSIERPVFTTFPTPFRSASPTAPPTTRFPTFSPNYNGTGAPSHAPTAACPQAVARLVGDGWCDGYAPVNTAECQWDGGDCCIPSSLTMECRDPTSEHFGRKAASVLGVVPRNPRYTVDVSRQVTTEDLATTYNNFYEFGMSKDISQAAIAQGKAFLDASTFTISIGGLVENPLTLSAADLIAHFVLEERLYRHRCVEAWSIVVPWIGFPLAKLLDLVKPTAAAKYIRFTTFKNATVSPVQASDDWDWPYVEGMSIDEAQNDLSFLSVGMYQKRLPPQNGAPLRLTLPWKYGFKSIKSIRAIEFTAERPATFWATAAPKEYGFWANVNPSIPHPRWSQAQEREMVTSAFGGKRIPTEIYNGYGSFVSHLYDGAAFDEDRATGRLFM